MTPDDETERRKLNLMRSVTRNTIQRYKDDETKPNGRKPPPITLPKMPWDGDDKSQDR